MGDQVYVSTMESHGYWPDAGELSKLTDTYCFKNLIHFSFYLWAVTHNYTKVLSACGTASADTYITIFGTVYH